MYQRSADVGLGLPFNISSYAVLTYILAKLTGLKPSKIIIVIGDAHIYESHIDTLKEQITKVPYSFPKLELKEKEYKIISDFTIDDFIINDYKYHTFSDTTIEGDFNGSMMSSVNGLRNNTTGLVKVSTATLEGILDSVTVNTIDLLSLDAEGYEYEILCGLNLKKYRPMYMLIEIYNTDYDMIVNFLEKNQYKLYSNFSNYNKITNHNWDGTHNDYLFRDCTIDLLI
jgi:hypothetical protein